MFAPEYLAVFAPLAGFVIAGLGNKRLGAHGAEYITCALMVVAAWSSLGLFQEFALGDAKAHVLPLMSWFEVGPLKVDWALRFDTLTAVMLVVVNFVSCMVHIYSVGYMSHDEHRPRFFAYLSLFTFAMLMLVTANNLVQLFFGWEGVGLASYLLINFWFHKPSANAASIKAFLVNRVGDFGFVLGIFGCFLLFGTVDFDKIFASDFVAVTRPLEFFYFNIDGLTIVCLLLFMGAMGKSAQLGLHTWLPDAMEGPTPVSALIHAATMVTAGVFMLCRLSPLYEAVPHVLAFVCVVGALTAFVAATIGMTQWDIKRVIAYSTMSQLGYMFFAIGVSAYGAAMFHLMTHAFFKALLFLGSGSVIHALEGEQDMRKMGGLWRKIPFTYVLMWIGSLALAGVPFFAGYYSKDIILESAWASHSLVGQGAYILGLAAAVMTAFYSWRLLILTFHGNPRGGHHVFDHAHESPPVMLLPLFALAVGALFSGWIAYDWFVGEGRGEFWKAALFYSDEDSIHHAHHVETLVKLLPTLCAIFGIAFAFYAYQFTKGLPEKISQSVKPLYELFYNKWYFDPIYDRVFVKPALQAGDVLWKKGDAAIIDAFGPDGVAAAAAEGGKNIVKLQTGYLYHYAFVMVIGLAALGFWLLMGAK